MIEWIKRGTCRADKDVPTGAVVVAVNGREVMGRCVCCERRLFVDSDYVSDPEEELICRACLNRLTDGD